MPTSFKLSLAYRLFSVRFVDKNVEVSITTRVALTDQNVSDLAFSHLAETLYRQREAPGLADTDFTKLTLYIERLKVTASGREVYGGACAVIHSTIRPERQSAEPGSLSVCDFDHRSVAPHLSLLDATWWTNATRNHVIDPRWNRGRFTYLDIPLPMGGTGPSHAGDGNGVVAPPAEPGGETGMPSPDNLPGVIPE